MGIWVRNVSLIKIICYGLYQTIYVSFSGFQQFTKKRFTSHGYECAGIRLCVFCMPIPLRVCLARAAQEVRGTSDLRGPEWNVDPRVTKLFYAITEIQINRPKTVVPPSLQSPLLSQKKKVKRNPPKSYICNANIPLFGGFFLFFS